ncbi:TetR/AcrR family transcriptional regulator [Promicromonospora thailandica]|uniref:Transcriptional regulator, TetR family n=1 Tax=Promicromonospora thailandica TaxID=765201 RepID=A0A9X2JWM9_9MICO|nr:TetR/AcrR family transcriptional regulator [Promicromonospora thailandica]MCP2263269.1 transcriptional regulator, TetR family [Promicromonospora thailandica]
MSVRTVRGPARAATDDETRPAAAERILDAADTLFDAHGIRAVSADKIIDTARTAKATFYRHFRTKDELVVAYLERRAAQELSVLDGIRGSARDGSEELRLLADGIESEIGRPEFRGCPFLNAAAEYPDPESPVRAAVARQRTRYRTVFAQMLGRLGVADLAVATEAVMMLRDGAMTAGRLDGGRDRRTLAVALFAVVDAHRTETQENRSA